MRRLIHRSFLAVLLGLGVIPAQAQDRARLAVGAKVFESSCKSCHDSGRPQNEAPQLSEKAEWKERYGKGIDALYKSSIEGFSGNYAMPARGDDPTLSDDQVKAAVDYLLQRAGVR